MTHRHSNPRVGLEARREASLGPGLGASGEEEEEIGDCCQSGNVCWLASGVLELACFL